MNAIKHVSFDKKTLVIELVNANELINGRHISIIVNNVADCFGLHPIASSQADAIIKYEISDLSVAGRILQVIA